MSTPQELLAQSMLERLQTRIQHVVNQQPLSLDYLEFVCSQEVVLFSVVSDQVHIPEAIGLCVPHIDWEDSGLLDDPHYGVTIPESGNVLNPEQIVALRAAIDPMGPSDSHGYDIYVSTVHLKGSIQGYEQNAGN
ncbi:unnamed protein product [Menidia menidia]|uniref:(Atlantic silverside) hypothetical protein n=1 Tax=Menidia menidia TaxID=238744 RepID=A0A8S4BN81_9TELE|nr:unnamed protein product [Menidia menidia]